MIPLQAIRIASVIFAFGVCAFAQGTLVIVDPTIDGDTVSLPIHLQGAVADGVAAMDFQFQFDAVILQPINVQAGAAAVQAGKDVRAELVDDGFYSVLMFGGNLTSVAQGEIARIAMSKVAEPASGETPVTIAATAFATVSGVEIPSLGSTTSLLFDSDGDSGGAGSLPPVGGGGVPAEGPVEPPEALPEPAEKVESESPQDATPPVTSANPRTAADIQIANLQQARAEREAARAELNSQATESGRGEKVLRTRREPWPSRQAMNGDPGSEPRPSSLDRESNAAGTIPRQREPQSIAQAVDDTVPAVEVDVEPMSPLNSGEVIDDGRGAANSVSVRGLWGRAVVLGACIAGALGLYAVQRRR